MKLELSNLSLKNKIMKVIKKISIVLYVIVLAAVGGIAYYFYHKYQTLKNNPGQAELNEVKVLVEKVGKLIELPDETPTIATVLDKEKLKDQPFFKNAENGDKVLVFINAKKAILYRPSNNKIIEVAPLTIEEGSNSESPGTEKKAEAAVKIALLNGTDNPSLLDETERKIKENLEDVEIVKKGSASKKNYKKTIVEDVSGNFSSLASEIAKLLSGEVGTLPQGENKPEADIIVLLGK